ncbi:hypothetical protein WICPIJ_008249 [Wickerhamomyces pijperi]|uniref:Uncharacterized protein n=1 Tax=Wickerhamomyces pijperi TaxID=599730 RepID=A0A9P8TIY3_WICPI|nr:hypothetical protein WICPIJ_008249 [Wickerhamomyces pijperi]
MMKLTIKQQSFSSTEDILTKILCPMEDVTINVTRGNIKVGANSSMFTLDFCKIQIGNTTTDETKADVTQQHHRTKTNTGHSSLSTA